ncbi:hypothetical protein SLA2020_425660 [Shorea laevis]
MLVDSWMRNNQYVAFGLLFPRKVIFGLLKDRFLLCPLVIDIWRFEIWNDLSYIAGLVSLIGNLRLIAHYITQSKSVDMSTRFAISSFSTSGRIFEHRVTYASAGHACFMVL